ncbi:hypothetical protein ACLOJK_016423 [Asimina triloba]
MAHEKCIDGFRGVFLAHTMGSSLGLFGNASLAFFSLSLISFLLFCPEDDEIEERDNLLLRNSVPVLSRLSNDAHFSQPSNQSKPFHLLGFVAAEDPRNRGRGGVSWFGRPPQLLVGLDQSQSSIRWGPARKWRHGEENANRSSIQIQKCVKAKSMGTLRSLYGKIRMDHMAMMTTSWLQNEYQVQNQVVIGSVSHLSCDLDQPEWGD